MTKTNNDQRSDKNKSSEEIEREVERTRANVSETLEELRERMSPTNIVDQVVGLARETGADDAIAAAGRAVKNNPLPFLVIGAGLAWLVASSLHKSDPEALADKRARRRERRVAPPEYGTGSGEYGSTVGYGRRFGRKRSAADHLRDAAEDAQGAAAEGIEDASESLSKGVRHLRAQARSAKRAAVVSAADEAEAAGHEAAGLAGRAVHVIGGAATSVYQSASGLAGSAVHAIADTASHAAHAAGETVGSVLHDATGIAKGYGRAAHEHRRTLGDRAHSTGEKAMSYGRETAGAALHRSRAAIDAVVDYQPALILGALGFAAGAVIGAALPSTDAENRLMGEKSDEVKNRARQLADEQMRKAREAAGRVYEEVKEDAESQDFAGIPGEVLSSVGGRVRHIAETARSAAREQVSDVAQSAEDALNDSVEALSSGLKTAGGKATEATSKAADSVVRVMEAGARTAQDVSRGAERMAAETKASTPSSATVQPAKGKAS